MDLSLVDPDVYQRSGPPHERFAWLRAHDPVHWHADGGAPGWPGFWAVTRHQDVEHVSRHPEIYSSAQRLSLFGEVPEENIQLQRLMMLNMDPPQHTRQRAFVNRGFTPRMIGRLRSTSPRSATTCWTAWRATGQPTSSRRSPLRCRCGSSASSWARRSRTASASSSSRTSLS